LADTSKKEEEAGFWIAHHVWILWKEERDKQRKSVGDNDVDDQSKYGHTNCTKEAGLEEFLDQPYVDYECD